MRPVCPRYAYAAHLLVLGAFVPANLAQQPAAAQSTAATPVLRSETRLVSIDVVVTDGLGNSVRGLALPDFVVRESKSVQRLNGFEEHSAGAASQIKLAQPSPDVFTNRNVATTAGAVTVLVIDALNTPRTDQAYLRSQLVKYLATVLPGAPLAVFSLTTRVHMLQDFTSDPALLRQAITALGPRFSRLGLDRNDTAARQESENYNDLIANAPDPAVKQMLRDTQTALLQMEAERASQQIQLRARETMDMLRAIARYLAGTPGRKNLLWFSGGFPVNIQRDVITTGDPFAGAATLEPEFRKTVELLGRSHVAVYPIDSRGLQTPPSMHITTEVRVSDLQRNSRDVQFDLDQAQEHDTMRELAERTGGEAFYNTNGLSEATAQAVRDSSQYYTLTYTPSASDAKGFRTISVKLASRKGLHLAYRHGYFAELPLSNPSPSAGTDKVLQKSADALQDLAVRTVPDSSEIALRLEPNMATGDTVPGKAVGSKLYGAAGTVYRMDLRILNAEDIAFVSPGDGKEHATLDFVTLLFDGKGKLVDSLQNRLNMALNAAQMRAFTAGGLRLHQNIVLPASSDLAVRMIVRDATTDHTGSVLVSADAIGAAAKHSQ